VAGRIDFLSGLDAAYKDELLTPSGTLNPYYSGKAYLQKTPYLNTEYLGVNPEADPDSPLANADIRKALSLTLDRKELIAYIRNGIGVPATQSFVPPVLLGEPQKNSNIPNSVRWEEVRNLIQNTSYGTVENVPPFVLYTDVNYTDLCTAILNQWKKYGFRVSLEVLDRPTLKSQVAKGQLVFFRASWIADYPDAENYLSLFYSANFSPAGPNYTQFRSDALDVLYLQSLKETRDSVRLHIYRQIDSLVIAGQPVIPLFYDEVTRFIRKEVSGLPPHPMNHLDLRRVRKRIDN
jgi:peptide/nickel transport system substrate-binding protein